jgi:ABC-type molybdenum transport system ATPase subunit/photorepair protein PhrA
LITSDHPQTYAAPLRLFGRTRLPSSGQPGISIFDIQSRIGHSSPEVHTFFPRGISVRRTLESAWADTPISKPRGIGEVESSKVDACLRWFWTELSQGNAVGDTSFVQKDGNSSDEYERLIHQTQNLEWARDVKFGELSFSAQRIILFLRAIIRSPEIVILDEAFSGMDDDAKDKCLLFLESGERLALEKNLSATQPIVAPSLQSAFGVVKFPGLLSSQALLVVSHMRDQVPRCVTQWMTLPEPGQGPPRIGRLDRPISQDDRAWSTVWGLNS